MHQQTIYILGIESSCDDTSAAVIKNDRILSNIVASQDIHKKYGGVVPELASRSHSANIIPVVDAALKEANITKNDLTAIAFTRGPGLLGSLLVGTSFAKGMSIGLKIPLLDVHHMKAHILAHFIDGSNIVNASTKPQFPFLCLTISGGHTQIVLVKNYDKMEVIGETIDDAAGEAFDKVAKLIGLPYPGGPEVDRLAQQGNPDAFSFPHPQVKNYDFSFSGLKTSVLYFLKKQLEKNSQFIEVNKNDLCASFQKTVVDILMQKMIKASMDYGIKHIALAGGVSANSSIRKAMLNEGEKYGWNVYIPKLEYCTDNAAMIAIAGYFNYLSGKTMPPSFGATARWEIGSND